MGFDNSANEQAVAAAKAKADAAAAKYKAEHPYESDLIG